MVTPVEKLEIPDTVQSILSARIDRLLEREKRVLQTAAVIGREFPEPILEAVVDFAREVLQESLDQLKAGEFIHSEALYPVAEYAFKHPLTQEVALNSQLHEKRRGVHGARARQSCGLPGQAAHVVSTPGRTALPAGEDHERG